MPRPILTVPTPCHESWAAMTPAAQGRHCAACSKVVVDFTRMTDAELVAFLGQNTGPTCGRFRAAQLDRPLLPAPPAPYWSRLVAAALTLAGLGAAAGAAAQSRPAAAVEVRSITLGLVATPAPAPRLALPPVVVRGIVLDSATKEPLPGATVLVRGTTNGVSTGPDGRFELLLPAAAQPAGPVELHINFIGYVSQAVFLRTSALPEPLTVALAADGQMLSGEVVVIDAPNGPRQYTPRGLWNRLTQLFRR